MFLRAFGALLQDVRTDVEYNMVKSEKYLKRNRPFYQSEMLKVIFNIRQFGKSTIVRQIIQKLRDARIPEKRTIYINYEYLKYIKDACICDQVSRCVIIVKNSGV